MLTSRPQGGVLTSCRRQRAERGSRASFEDQPRAFEALAYGFAAPAGYDAHEFVAVTGEFFERLDKLLAVQDEEHPVLFGELFDGFAARLLGAHGLGEQPLALGRL